MPGMNINYMARQPVLDLELKTWGYELLFRAGIENSFENAENSFDGDTATMSVINNALLDNINSLTRGTRSLINFTRSLILDDYTQLLNKDNMIIELLEDIRPDEEIVQACQELKKRGYTIALDDFFFSTDYHELLQLADIVKLDFIASTRDELEEVTQKLKPYKVTLLAEKIETYADFEFARNIGCELFQGYFFSKPIMVKRENVQESKFIKLRLISEVNSSSFVIGNIEEIIKSDPVLTLRLLQYINSVHFALRNTITSVHQAILMLGPKKVKRWVTVIAVSELNEGRPLELLKESLFRAKFCEIIGQNVGDNNIDDEFFLLGLFSHIDAFFGMPKDVLLRDLPISGRVKDALLGKEENSLLYFSLEISRALGLGMWDYVDNIACENKIDGNLIKIAYLNAVNQSNEHTMFMN